MRISDLLSEGEETTAPAWSASPEVDRPAAGSRAATIRWAEPEIPTPPAPTSRQPLWVSSPQPRPPASPRANDPGDPGPSRRLFGRARPASPQVSPPVPETPDIDEAPVVETTPEPDAPALITAEVMEAEVVEIDLPAPDSERGGELGAEPADEAVPEPSEAAALPEEAAPAHAPPRFSIGQWLEWTGQDRAGDPTTPPRPEPEAIPEPERAPSSPPPFALASTAPSVTPPTAPVVEAVPPQPSLERDAPLPAVIENRTPIPLDADPDGRRFLLPLDDLLPSRRKKRKRRKSS